MPSNSKTHLNRAFDHLDNVIYIMGEVIKEEMPKRSENILWKTIHSAAIL